MSRVNLLISEGGHFRCYGSTIVFIYKGVSYVKIVGICSAIDKIQI